MTLLITWKNKTRRQLRIECVENIDFQDDYMIVTYAKYRSIEMPDYKIEKMILVVNDILRMVMA